MWRAALEGCKFCTLWHHVQGAAEIRVMDLQRPLQGGEWKVILDADDDVDCLKADYWRDGRFLLLIDDDDAPDGEIVGVDIARFDSTAKIKRKKGAVGDDSSAEDLRVVVPFLEGVEIEDFAIAGQYLAVAVKRDARCYVDVYDLQSAATASEHEASSQAQEAASVSDVGGTRSHRYNLRSRSNASQPSQSEVKGSGQHNGQPSTSQGFTRQSNPVWTLSFDDPTLVVSISNIGPPDSSVICLTQSSLVTPVTTTDVNLATHTSVTKHTEEVQRLSSRMLCPAMLCILRG